MHRKLQIVMRFYNNIQYIYAQFNQPNRGRGEANRTHDVSLKDFKFYKINKVDKTEYYDVFMRKYPLDIEFETIETPIRPNITNIGHVIKKSTCLWDEMELEKKEIFQ